MNDTNYSIEILVAARNAAVAGLNKALTMKDAESAAGCRAYIARMDKAIAAKG